MTVLPYGSKQSVSFSLHSGQGQVELVKKKVHSSGQSIITRNGCQGGGWQNLQRVMANISKMSVVGGETLVISIL